MHITAITTYTLLGREATQQRTTNGLPQLRRASMEVVMAFELLAAETGINLILGSLNCQWSLEWLKNR